MANPSVVILSSSRSFLAESLRMKFEETPNKAKCCYNLSPSSIVSDITEENSALILFLDSQMLKDIKSMFFLKDFCIEKNLPIFLVGETEDLQRAEKMLPMEQIQHSFYRPIDISEVSQTVTTYISFFKREDQKKLLIVDDSGTALRTAKGWFESGYRVYLANSATMAIKSMATNRPDAILMDYDMPICNGCMVYEMIKAESDYADVPVFFLTGIEDPQITREIMSHRPAGYMVKTMPGERIVRTVDNYFANHPSA